MLINHINAFYELMSGEHTTFRLINTRVARKRPGYKFKIENLQYTYRRHLVLRIIYWSLPRIYRQKS